MRIALLISGGGSTAQAVINATKNGKLQNLITPAVVVSSRSDALGIQKAKELGVPVEIVRQKDYSSPEGFGQALCKVFETYNIEFISQNGWMAMTPINILEKFVNNIINQHPGPLDPGFADFGGKGMYGERVTCARLVYCILTQDENPWTEATVQFVTEEYDKGALISVRELPFEKVDRRISQKDIVENISVQEFIKNKTKQIQQELLPLEHENVIETLYLLAQGKRPSFVRQERLVPEENLTILAFAKKMAIELF